MRINFATVAVLALGAQGVAASTWFGKAAYNKWHETELERWLSDHNVPYPAPADRKDLVDLVKSHWEDKVATPYNSWDANQLQNYISSQGQQVKKGTEQNKDSLISQVKQYWHETADQASDSYSSVQDWVFNSWTDSQLKAFLDYHHIPNPSPRTRDSLLSSVRSSYQSIADKAGETAAYPGNWLYTSWSDSELKAWLDERGIPVPQPSSRDKLVASIRRNARVASNKASEAAASASSSAAGAQQSLSDALLDSWSDSQLKAWFDKNSIKVPQGSKRNELVALARKHSAKLSGDNVSASASSVYGQASKSASSVSKSAGSQYASATDAAYGSAQYWFDWAKAQVGIGGEQAKASLASISSVASASASSLSSVGSNSLSSASSVGYDSLSSGASRASKSGTSLTGAAAASASSASKVAAASASSASKLASSSASSASKVASSSASSASKAASKGGAGYASQAAASVSSASKVAAASASSASKAASKGGSGYVQQAADAATENASSAKHKASELAQKATDRVKEEL